MYNFYRIYRCFFKLLIYTAEKGRRSWHNLGTIMHLRGTAWGTAKDHGGLWCGPDHFGKRSKTGRSGPGPCRVL